MVVIQTTMVSSLNLKCKYDLNTMSGSLRMIQVRSNLKHIVNGKLLMKIGS